MCGADTVRFFFSIGSRTYQQVFLSTDCMFFIHTPTVLSGASNNSTRHLHSNNSTDPFSCYSFRHPVSLFASFTGSSCCGVNAANVQLATILSRNSYLFVHYGGLRGLRACSSSHIIFGRSILFAVQ